MANAKKDDNRTSTLIAVSSADLDTPVRVAANPITGALVVDASVSVTGGATEAAQTDGSQKTQIVDAGGEIATITGGKLDVNASIDTTGLATSAGQTTGNGYLQTVAGAVSGTEMQVDVLTMPTTTVQATDLDVRDLTSTDVVTVTGGAGQSADVKVTLDSESVAVTGTFWQATQPVSGTVTANLSATDNTVLDNIDSNTASIKTAVETIDNAISGSEMQVDVVGSLPSGSNAIGKLVPPDIDITTHSNYIRKYYTSAGAATDGIIWSTAAGKRWHVVSLYINVSAAATVTLEDDKSSGDDPVWKGEFAANSGIAFTFSDKYPLASGEDAADLTITTTAGNVYCTVVGYEI